MHKRIAIGILVFGGVITLVALLTPAQPSRLRLGANVEDAVKQIESKRAPTPDSDRPKYVPYRSFHLSWGGGTLETDMDYCFPRPGLGDSLCQLQLRRRWHDYKYQLAVEI
jgi:hypothetical protein